MQPVHSQSIRPTLLLFLTACAVALAGCARTDTGDLVTTASTAAALGYAVEEELDEEPEGEEEADYSRARDFAADNRLALRRDAARGEGDYAAALAALMGEPDAQAFGQFLKVHYEQLFHQTESDQDLVSRIVAIRDDEA